MRPRQPSSTLFPYTTLFRSCLDRSSCILVRKGKWLNRAVFECRTRLLFRCTMFVSNQGERKGNRPLDRSEEHTSELQSHVKLVCRLLLEKKKLISIIQVIL